MIEKEDWEKSLREFEALEKLSMINLEHYRACIDLAKKKLKEFKNADKKPNYTN